MHSRATGVDCIRAGRVDDDPLHSAGARIATWITAILRAPVISEAAVRQGDC
jgi:hypothetical protein